MAVPESLREVTTDASSGVVRTITGPVRSIVIENDAHLPLLPIPSLARTIILVAPSDAIAGEKVILAEVVDRPVTVLMVVQVLPPSVE